MNDAEVAYNELKALLDYLKSFAEAKSPLLHEAEIILERGNPSALQTLAGNLRTVRQDILSDLRSRLK